MTPGIQAPFLLLLLLFSVITATTTSTPKRLFTTSDHTNSNGNTQTETAQSSPTPKLTDKSSIPALTTTRSFREILLDWPGSVVVESTLAFREGTTNANNVLTQFVQHESDAAKYHLVISRVSVEDVSFPSSAQPGSGVPGWGIALLVLVCVLVALAIIYLIALAVCQCRRKNCGQLDIFPTRDAYHPMSEYPTYHTHGRYVPPGSSKRSPYEEVSAGNGGSSLSYTNTAATSANL
uniref:Mucin 1, cell surface associated n=1 Tax=Molossus molossus TaxID=27622 RepID=A0A7J8CSQ0_MOLMO|nr:mucin 1, cell surface associated [Molossus molossus]